MQNIQTACNYVNTVLLNASGAATGTPFDLSDLPNTGTFTWSVQIASGTVTAATINFMGSIDGLNWYMLDQMLNTDTQWSLSGNASGELRHIVNKPVKFVRIDVITLTGTSPVVNASFALFEPNR